MALRIAYVTTCRSDYSPSYWLIHDLFAATDLEPLLFVGGAHLSPHHGSTVREIEADGWPIAERLPFASEADNPSAHAAAAASAVQRFSDAFIRHSPDLVMLYGDRWELLPIATAAVLTSTPIAHLCGGDLTEGAIDEQVRHAVTKMAHLHFPSTALAASRLLAMGEEPWRVHNVGDPALDHFRRGERATDDELRALLGFVPDASTLLVTFHPPTGEPAAVRDQALELAAALEQRPERLILTAPAPDPGFADVRDVLQRLAASRPNTAYVDHLGARRYRAVLERVAAMVGNSSSGFNEAPCVPLPVVNVGTRQGGRERALNVIDAEPRRDAIIAAIDRAIEPAFRRSLGNIESPYGDGHSASRVIQALRALPERERLLKKRWGSPPIAPNQRAIGGDWSVVPSALCDSSTSLFATGRDALAAIATERPGRWLVASYTCPVVAQVLRRCGLVVVPYPMLDPWRPDLDALRKLVDGCAGIVVPFHFGWPPDEALWQLVSDRSLCVVEDRCQSPTPPPASIRGDFAIGSLRKCIAVIDGAWCVARRGAAPRPAGTAPLRPLLLRLSAGLAKAAFESGETESTVERAYVDLFQRGEATFGNGDGRPASALSEQLLAAVDWEDVRQKRLRNQRFLADRLADSPVARIWEPRSGATAKTEQPLLAVPLTVDDRDGLRSRLREARIYCPIHWTGGNWSADFGAANQWSEMTLSLPIDQRLTLDDLERMVRVIG